MNKKDLLKLQDKIAYLPVFAGLLKEPDKLRISSGYHFDLDDFPEKFHKILFSAINNLYEDGVKLITKIEINNYLSNFPDQYRIYQDNEGDAYLDAILELDEVENFDYHYTRIKKFSLLRHYASVGIDISDIYDIDVLDLKEEEEQNERFNNLTVDEIIKHIDAKVIDIKTKFLVDSDGGYGGHMGENIDEIVESKFQGLNYGYNMISGYLNTVARGARLRKLYAFSGNSGSGKTRSLLANVLNMCVPEMYVNGEWVKTNNKGRGLFVSTELEEEEIKIPAVCFIAEVEEDKIHENRLTKEEKVRIKRAMEILKESPVWFEELFDFDEDDVEYTIEKHVIKNNVDVVGFDYLHSTLKMFDSMGKKAKGLQEHQVLRIMSIRLKNICNKFNVWIGTGTQLNEAWKEGVYDQSALEGSKSIVNKLDLGIIQVPLTIKDEALFDEIKHSLDLGFGSLEPTHTLNIYKNRGNKWKMVRIWVHFNLGTLRMTDLFVTNYKGEVIENITPKMVEQFLEDEEDFDAEEVFDVEEEFNPLDFFEVEEQ